MRHNQPPIRFSIRNKILMLSAAATLPFLALAIILLFSMTNYSRTYDKIVSNLTIANNSIHPSTITRF